MELLDSVQVGKSQIELLNGDLTEVPAQHRADLLVISAFPDDYVPTPRSLIGALQRKGLSVEALATDKEEDLRATFSCWLSRELDDATSAGLGYRRVLCFEPPATARGKPPELVGDIFRALVPILGRDPEIKSMAMPIVAAGDQRYRVEEMLRPLLEATIHWLESGLPLDRVKIVTRSEPSASLARAVFADRKGLYLATTAVIEPKPDHYDRIPVLSAPACAAPPPERHPDEFDVFISYAHENAAEMQDFESHLRSLLPGVKVFIDRKNIDIGSPWQPEIFESLDRCRKVVALFSPDYLQSKVCKEEFNIAWVRSRESGKECLFPVYLFSAKLPTYMKYRSYFDCREGDGARLREASERLVYNLTQGIELISMGDDRERGPGSCRDFQLRVTESSGAVRVVRLDSGRIVVGRSPSSEVWIDDRGASREHLAIEWNAAMNYHVVEDRGSANGTTLNGHLASSGRERLRAGDEIRVGSTSIRYEEVPQ